MTKFKVIVLGILFLFSCSGKTPELKTAEEYLTLAKKENKIKVKMQLLDSVLLVNSTNLEAYLEKGFIYTSEKINDSALLCYNQAIKLVSVKSKKIKAKVHAERSIAYTLVGNDRMALNDIKKSISYDSTCYRAYYAWARYYDLMNDVDKEIAMYKKAIAYNANADSALYNLAYIYDEMGYTDSAYILLKKVVCIDSTSSIIWNSFGNYASTLKKYDEAFHAYEKAMQLDSLYFGAYISRAVVNLEVKDTAAAIADLNRFLRFAPYKDEKKTAARSTIIELGGVPIE